MSMESARAFIERMNNDREFAQRVINCKDKDVRMSFVKAADFDFSPFEIREASEELSVSEMNSLACGLCDSLGGDCDSSCTSDCGSDCPTDRVCPDW